MIKFLILLLRNTIFLSLIFCTFFFFICANFGFHEVMQTQGDNRAPRAHYPLTIINSQRLNAGNHEMEANISSPIYSLDIQSFPGGLCKKYFLSSSVAGNISFQNGLALLRSTSDESLRVYLVNFFKSLEFDSLFFECPPLTRVNLSKTQFQFVILPTNAFHGRKPDPVSFNDHFRGTHDMYISNFSSLGGDAVLLAPKPLPDVDIQFYTHLGTFLKNAPDVQIHALWQAVGSAILDTDILQGNPKRKIWLSTSGLGVSWLHVRLDTIPKYYQWAEYRHA